jgi:hypothetical protein
MAAHTSYRIFACCAVATTPHSMQVLLTIRGRAPYELELRWAYAPMPLGLTVAAREALIDQRVSEALAGVMPELREVERAADQIRPMPDIDQVRRQRVPRGTTARREARIPKHIDPSTTRPVARDIDDLADDPSDAGGRHLGRRPTGSRRTTGKHDPIAHDTLMHRRTICPTWDVGTRAPCRRPRTAGKATRRTRHR